MNDQVTVEQRNSLVCIDQGQHMPLDHLWKFLRDFRETVRLSTRCGPEPFYSHVKRRLSPYIWDTWDHLDYIGLAQL